MDFWDRTKERIKDLDLTQDILANKIGVSSRTFRGWMSRKIMPKADQVLLIASHLKVNPEWLVFGSLSRSGETNLILPSLMHYQIANQLTTLKESQLKMLKSLIDNLNT